MKMNVAARILLIAAAVAVVASKRHDPDLSRYERIAQEPDFTRSYSYVSPLEAETRFTRAAEPKKHVDETDSYKAFLDKYFSDSTANRPDYEAERSQKLRKDEDTERIDGNSREYDDNFHDTEYERIKAVSMEQEKQIKKNPKNCKVTVKDGMQCSTCKDPKTGSHSETCSFSSTPAEKKYAYVKERNYNSKDQDKEKQKKAADDEEGDEDDEEDEEDNGEDEKKSAASTTNEKKVRSTAAPTAPPPPKPITRNRGPPMAKQNPTNRPILRNTQRPQRSQSLRAATTSAPSAKRPQFHSSYKTPTPETRPKRRVIGLDPFLYGSHSSDAKSEQLKKRSDDDDKSVEEDPHSRDRTYEDYFSHVFPEAKNGRLTRDEDEGRSAADDVEFVPDYDSKKNVEKVLAEFKTKDWSTCKKEIRGDLTCYLCKDDNGVRHEECMFVSGSASKKEPKSSRLSYSETKEFHTPHTKEEPRKSENLRAAEQSEEPSDESDEEDDEEEVVVTTQKPTKKKKHSRKVVIRRRKTKELRPETDAADEPSTQDVGQHQSGGTKKTIKRMVSYEIRNHGSDDDDGAMNGRSMAFEHKVVHEA